MADKEDDNFFANKEAMETEAGMRSETLRLASFVHWPEDFNAHPIMLARAGFYKTNDSPRSDQVTCFSCGISISNWQPSDEPMEEHRKLSPKCLFFKPKSRNGFHGNDNIPMRSPNMSLDEAYAVIKGSCNHTTDEEHIGSSSSLEDSNDERREDSTTNAPHSLAVNSSSTIQNQTSNTVLQHNEACNIPPEQSIVGRRWSESQTSITGDDGDHDIVQAAIKRVPPTHKLSQPNPQPSSTDPRKRADFAFMDRMRSEKERRSTFYDWPQGAWQTMMTLAATGFFYTGSADRVQCAFCRGILRNWEPNDVPMEEHRRHFPHCPFINGRSVGNIPMASTNQQSTNHEHQPLTDFPVRYPERQTQGDTGLGIMTQRPKNPDFALEAKRVATFDHPTWPSSMKQSPTRMAEAGFFYVGYADNVKCFFCDGGLRNWESQDDPWVEHARWFPRCQFVQMLKGDTFIQSIQHNTDIAQLTEPSNPESVLAASGVTHKIEAREIKARMDTEIVKTVIDMGYPSEIIRKLIEDRLRTTGDDFADTKSLLNAILSLEDHTFAGKNQENVPGIATPQTGSEGNGGQNKKKKRNRTRKKRPEGPEQKCQNGTNSVMTQKEGTPEPNVQDDKHLNRNEEYQALIQENEEMKEQRMCKVCMDKEANTVFLPCAHLVCCASCSTALRNCPICRKIIKGTVRTFLA